MTSSVMAAVCRGFDSWCLRPSYRGVVLASDYLAHLVVDEPAAKALLTLLVDHRPQRFSAAAPMPDVRMLAHRTGQRVEVGAMFSTCSRTAAQSNVRGPSPRSRCTAHAM